MLNMKETVQDDSTESKGKRARSIALGNAYVKGLGGGGYYLFIHVCAVPYNTGGPHIYSNNVFIDPNIFVTTLLELSSDPTAFLCLLIHVCTNSFIQQCFQ